MERVDLSRMRRGVGVVLVAAALAVLAGVVVPTAPTVDASGTAVTNFIVWDTPSGTQETTSAFTVGGSTIASYTYNVTNSGTLVVFNPPGTTPPTTSVYVRLTGEYRNNLTANSENFVDINLSLPGGAQIGKQNYVKMVGVPVTNSGSPKQIIEFFEDAAFTTTTSVSNVIMPIFSLGNTGGPAGIARWVFEQNLVVISANSAANGTPATLDKTSLGKDRLSGGEANLIVQKLGTFDKIEFEAESAENWVGWNLGATNVAPPESVLTADRTVVTGNTGVAITPVEFTATTSASGQQTFELSGNLPAGLSFSTTTGAITGTPTEATASATVVVTVKDSSWGDKSLTITFNISAAVVPPPPPNTTASPTTTAPPVTTVPSPATTAPATTVPPATTLAPVPVDGGALPSLSPGASQVLIDGVAESVQVFVEESTDLVMKGQDFELRLAGECSLGCRIETTADGRQVLTLEERGLANVSGAGFSPGTPVYVWLFSEPTFLGELTVNADGSFTGTVPLGDIAPGEHTLQVNGTSFDGRPRSANLGVLVNPVLAPVLPSTGSDPFGLWVLSVSLLALGLILVVRRRPRLVV